MSNSPPPAPEPSFSCRWEGCSLSFPQLQDLVYHLSEDHIGRKKGVYSCDWTDCPRKGLPQTTRFALISHLRSHTGEKPYDCPAPECDKSFTRSDALAKHFKQQHGDTVRDPHTQDTSPLHKSAKHTRHSGVKLENELVEEPQAVVDHEETSESESSADDQSYSEKYLFEKAKYRYIKRESECLSEEYLLMKKKLRRLQTEKNVLLDAVTKQSLEANE
ncbi:hypothetical protein K493DRAFT_205550 [Basidiobolus meristosporus CBS 931.73]|uniref:C2H2-type domain-containing protein n=1 Tax=Basidiobolus meristosporus CBS 931.73 TaxID=1314790 RepID=A0A1Y1Z339_9FUNG|nr:hypothetical protein K493DRAFT_205550 [Basidiobolus meristosporus CBS 931.73]|eukprot:ORY04606.1 hypothetical protein K493DRAFT_205550 [Basidiobolus meristosporus CBS 931.73]